MVSQGDVVPGVDDVLHQMQDGQGGLGVFVGVQLLEDPVEDVLLHFSVGTLELQNG